jgi:hypothetical protein
MLDGEMMQKSKMTVALVFSAAGAFTGARPGFVFKMGELGLGYYPDRPPLQATAAEAEDKKKKKKKQKKKEVKKDKQERRKEGNVEAMFDFVVSVSRQARSLG